MTAAKYIPSKSKENTVVQFSLVTGGLIAERENLEKCLRSFGADVDTLGASDSQEVGEKFRVVTNGQRVEGLEVD